MKKTIIIIFFLSVAVSEFVNAQTNLNFSAGVNNSNCTYKNIEGFSSEGRLGYFVGVAPSHQINDRLKLVVDFQVSTKGCKTILKDNPLSSELKISYFDIIPEVEFNLLEYVSFGIGVNAGFKFNEAQKLEDQKWVNLKDLGIIDLFDFGLTGKIKATYKNIFAFVRYNYGLTSVSNIAFTGFTGQNADDGNQFNRNLQIGVGYSLNL